MCLHRGIAYRTALMALYLKINPDGATPEASHKGSKHEATPANGALAVTDVTSADAALADGTAADATLGAVASEIAPAAAVGVTAGVISDDITEITEMSSADAAMPESTAIDDTTLELDTTSLELPNRDTNLKLPNRDGVPSGPAEVEWLPDANGGGGMHRQLSISSGLQSLLQSLLQVRHHTFT